jgi:Mg-chelatase subunit ChlD
LTGLPACAQNQAVKPSSMKLYGEVNELLSACANAGVEITSTTLPAHIQKVRMGSAAFYAGLQDNDVILKGTLDNNRLHLTFRRGAALYAVDLATQAGASTPSEALKSGTAANTLANGTPATTLSTGTPTTTLSTGTTATTKDPAWKKLKTYDIVMLIDQSGSMADTVDGNGTSKWGWCSEQLTSFASQALENTGKRFTIITFNGEFKLRSNCSPQDVQQTFLSNRPNGSTDLGTPLDFVLKDYLGHTHVNPLLVVVLTDGMPNNPEAVEQSIIETTKRVSSADQIKIVFFEIGNDAEGASLLKLLDFGLVSEGARYDIVDSNSFDRLRQVGLKTALYDTFNDNFQTSRKVAPSQNLQESLEAIRKQLQDARARSAQNPPNR